MEPPRVGGRRPEDCVRRCTSPLAVAVASMSLLRAHVDAVTHLPQPLISVGVKPYIAEV
jgi:hypothetical protein